MDCFVAARLAMTANKNAPEPGAFCCSARPEDSVLFQEARELLLKAGNAAAAIHQLLGAAGPRRVRFRVDVEVQRVAFLAPGRARLVLGAVGHHDLNHMIIRVNFGFHDIPLWRRAPVSVMLRWRIWAGL